MNDPTTTICVEAIEAMRKNPLPHFDIFEEAGKGEQMRFVRMCHLAYSNFVYPTITSNTRVTTIRDRFRTVAELVVDQSKSLKVFERRTGVIWEQLLISLAIALFRMWWESREK